METVPRAVVGALVILIVLATAFFVARGYQESRTETLPLAQANPPKPSKALKRAKI